MADQAERLRELSRVALSINDNNSAHEERPCARVLAVTSGKGGVGKSSFSVNLALALAGFGKKVLVIDADVGMANIDVMIGCLAQYNLLDIIEGTRSFEEVAITGPRNIKLLPGGSGVKSLVALTSLELQRLINQTAQFERAMDFILLDTGAGMSDNVINFLLSADDILLVTTPEPTSLTDAYAIIKVYSANAGQAKLSLVINRVEDERESASVAAKLGRAANRFLGVDLEPLGYVLEDAAMTASIRSQNPLILQFPSSPAADCINKIAHKIVFGQNPVKDSFVGFFKRLLNVNNIIGTRK